jgi:(E)-4-hydroxy-3-methylbut-2-enyl-diphosphate synthase
MISIDSESRPVADVGTASVRLTLPYIASPFAYRRRKTHVVMVGDVAVGGDNPIRVQSMTTTRTLDTEATVAQGERLVRVGCEIVRITAPTPKDARNLGEIKRQLQARGIHVPLVADIHFSPDAALEAADHVEKVRINPGNYADTRKFAVRSYTDAEYEAELARIEERFAPLVEKCKAKRIAMRIGTNHGSLSDRIVNRFGDTPEGMVESALEFVRICEKHGYYDVILSMKASNPKVMIAAYRLLAARMAELGMTYPFHLGVTEAGNGIDGRMKSTIGSGSLLADGIGDTIRVSLTEEPEEEIPVAFQIANFFTPREGDGRHPRSLLRGEGTGPARDGEVAPDQASLLAREGTGEPTIPDLDCQNAPKQSPLPLGEGQGESGLLAIPWDPFHYERRASRTVRVGPVGIGGENVVAVVARVGAAAEAQLLRWASPGNRRLARPDVVEWPVPDDTAVAALRAARQRLETARSLVVLSNANGSDLPKLAVLASGDDPVRLLEAIASADAVLLGEPSPAAAANLAEATRAAGKALWLEVEVGAAGSEAIDSAVARLLAARAASVQAGQEDVVLAIGAATADVAIYAQRLLVVRLAELGALNPLFVRTKRTPPSVPPQRGEGGRVGANGELAANREMGDAAAAAERLIPGALVPGSLLCDGLGDAIQAGTSEGGQDEVQLTLDVLQGSGTRLSKTDYVACPSCGRTLFDLQSTTERIKAQTSHLVGVKIAIMGCVVNGPGEMADADFGYVGGSPGHVNLYVGKTCVERNVPTEIADAKLIELIKSKGRWQEPEPVEAS